MIAEFKNWLKQRRLRREKARATIRCAAGHHDWRTLNEQDSILSVFCDMQNVPSRCAHCHELAYTDWVHGKGITQWRRVPDDDLSPAGLAFRAASKA